MWDMMGWNIRETRHNQLRVDPALSAREAAVRQAEITQQLGTDWGVRAPPDHRNPEWLHRGKWAAVMLREDYEAHSEARGALSPLIKHRIHQGVAWDGGTSPGLILVDRRPPGNIRAWQRQILGGQSWPHYLVFIGGPDRFPFELQYALARTLCIGRIDASDRAGGALSWAACRRYAEKVVRYERGDLPTQPYPLLFSVDADPPTSEAHALIAVPLAERTDLSQRPPATLFHEAASWDNLIATMATSPPGLLLTLTHGVEYPEDPLLWGALTDSPCIKGAGEVYLDAKHVTSACTFGAGAVVLALACFSAGVPSPSAHDHLLRLRPPALPNAPFVSPLPRALLAHPEGPVAFVGHVDRLTTRSFIDRLPQRGAAPFEDFIAWFLGGPGRGGTLGQAMRTLCEHASEETGQVLTQQLNAPSSPVAPTHDPTLDRRIRYCDYRGYILLGDPAITYPGFADPRHGLS